MSAQTCTLRICHNIHGVQVFRLLWYDVIYHFLQQPNSLSECFRFGKPAIRAYPISSGLPPLFLASSIASRYTSVFFFATTRSIASLAYPFPLLRNNQAILAYIPLCYLTRYLAFCLDYGKLVFAVCLWLSSSTLRELGYMHPFCSFPSQSRETEISD